MSAGKGDTERPVQDWKQFSDNWDAIDWGRKEPECNPLFDWGDKMKYEVDHIVQFDPKKRKNAKK